MRRAAASIQKETRTPAVKKRPWERELLRIRASPGGASPGEGQGLERKDGQHAWHQVEDEAAGEREDESQEDAGKPRTRGNGQRELELCLPRHAFDSAGEPLDLGFYRRCAREANRARCENLGEQYEACRIAFRIDAEEGEISAFGQLMERPRSPGAGPSDDRRRQAKVSPGPPGGRAAINVPIRIDVQRRGRR